MAQDFASRQRKKTPHLSAEGGRSRGAARKKTAAKPGLEQKLWSRLPGWGWLGVGLVSGLLLAQLFDSSAEPVQKTPTLKEEAATAAEAPSASGSSGQAVVVEAEDAQPRFDFYTLLPESEVIAPKVEAYQSTPRDAAHLPRYMLQTGSFRQRADALRQQQQLQQMGFDNAKISVAEADTGTWYRVRIGPYQDRRLRARAQDDLADAGLNFMLLSLGPAPQPKEQPDETAEVTPAETAQPEASASSPRASSSPTAAPEQPVQNKPAAPAAFNAEAGSTGNNEEAGNLPRFMLQAGSFSRLEDAQRQERRLSALGFSEIQISAVATAGGDTWHRVQVGPYRDPAIIARAQEILKTAAVDFMLLRLRD